MEVENSTARYSEHIKALFASPEGVHWTHAGRVVRVFATYNQRSSYAKEVDTNHRYTMLTPVLLYRMDLIVLRQSPPRSVEGSLSLRLLCSYYTGEGWNLRCSTSAERRAKRTPRRERSSSLSTSSGGSCPTANERTF